MENTINAHFDQLREITAIFNPVKRLADNASCTFKRYATDIASGRGNYTAMLVSILNCLIEINRAAFEDDCYPQSNYDDIRILAGQLLELLHSELM